MSLQIRLLGDFEIRYAEKILDGFDTPRLQSLLAYLVLHQDAPQSRKQIAFLLWQDSYAQQAHGNLRNLLHRLKKLVPHIDEYLAADAQTLQWRAEAPFTADVTQFQKLLAGARDAAALTTAVKLYRGDLLPACYDEWLLPERERLHELYLGVLAQLVELTRAEREWHTAIGYARRRIQADPLSEEAYCRLMELYAETGDRANLVRTYQTCAAVLKRELDTEPGATTRELFERLRRRDIVVEHPVAARNQPRPNVPTPLTSFIGRTRELDEMGARFLRARLVTLTGAGGVGKTRLAIQAAHRLAGEFVDGAWFVELAALTNPNEIALACAEALGLREQAGVSAQALILDFVRDKNLLLVLDNCEHLLNACAAFAKTILENAPRVKILATSREPLNLLGEAILTVPPLALPADHAPETIAHSDAVQLFAARASFFLPTFVLNQNNAAAVAQICRRLDGIPLAIELAAARVRSLAVPQIAARLDDSLAVLTRGVSGMPARHQTMRAVLDWSNALLSEPERVLFRRLAVFAGSFTLEAAEMICGDGEMESKRDGEQSSLPLSISPSLILDLLSNLIDKSLVQLYAAGADETTRYRLLEPIRQYAQENLEQANEQNIFAAHHLAWYKKFGEQMRAVLEGPSQAYGFAQLEREHDNLRAALEHAPMLDRAGGLALAVALERFWLIGGHGNEGHGLTKQLLALELVQGHIRYAPLPENPILLAYALTLAGMLALRRNELDQAELCLQEALNLFQTAQYRPGIAAAQNRRGEVARLRGEYARAIELQNASLNLWRQQENQHGIAHALLHLGSVYSETGNYDHAKQLYHQGLPIAEHLGDLWLIAVLKNNLGVALRLQDPARSVALAQETLEIRRTLGDRYGMAISLRNLGEMALARQDWTRAREMFTESLALNQTIHNEKGAADCLVGLAWVELAQGNPERAAQLLGHSEKLREVLGVVLPQDDRAEYDDLVAGIRAALDAQPFDAAWADGRARKQTAPD